MLPKRTQLLKCKVSDETILYEHSNECIEINKLNTIDEMTNHLLCYDVLILETNFHDL